jgi:carbonic anhydrase/acetyltransferase-like protein (isoleucine patch superfamily)
MEKKYFINPPSFLLKKPSISASAFVACSANIIGDVNISDKCSVWYQCVLRADINSISIGANTNVQDGSVIHVADEFGVSIGSHVTIGHKAIIHACEINDEVLIGMGTIILDGCKIGARSIIGAGSLVTKGTIIEPGSLVIGSPAKVYRKLSFDEQINIKNWAIKYSELSQIYLSNQL